MVHRIAWRRVSIVAVVASLLAMPLLAAAAGNVKPGMGVRTWLNGDEVIDVTITRGADVKPTAQPGISPDGMKAWLRLQLVQVYLENNDADNVMSNVGCLPHALNSAPVEKELRDNLVDCSIISGGTIWTPLMDQIDALTFTYQQTSTTAATIEKLIQNAFDEVNKGYPDAGFTLIKSNPHTPATPPLCIPPYHSPCVSNPACTNLGYCSTVSYACKQCK